jgi:NADH-quinone oxidoreductase subunit A
MNAQNPIIWPILVYGGLVAVLVAGMIGLSYVLGERHAKPGRDIPYESGIQPMGSARIRYDVRYYLVGVFFILFDVESAIIFAWAVAARRLGWPGYFGAMLFILTLVVGLIYVWKLGGLDWYQAMIHAGGEDE